MSRINVLGVGISPVNMREAVGIIKRWIHLRESHYVCVRDVHGVMECQKDEKLKNIHNVSGLTVPDGMPMVWAGRLYGFSNIGRVYGPDLMIELCRNSVFKGYTHFLYGGNAGVAAALKEALENRYPGIRIVGTYTPPFRPLNRKEEAELVELVSHQKPDLFWVGLSTPKQEYFMAEFIHKLDTRVMIGVGAAFDIHTGSVKDAPDWVKKIGMQWFHRLYQEPRRLWRRYLYNNPMFLCKFAGQLVRDKFSKGA